MKRVITIGREFGSGGREIGIKIAKELGIPFYDKEIIAKASKEGKLSSEIITKHDEKSPNFFSQAMVSPSVFSIYDLPLSDQVYIAQSNAIKQIASHGDCVIVGRTADSILFDSAIKIFIYADINDRVTRKCAMDTGIEAKNMEKHIRSIDKKRAKYYEHYTGTQWGKMKNHDLCINTSKVGIDGAVKVALDYINSQLIED